LLADSPVYCVGETPYYYLTLVGPGELIGDIHWSYKVIPSNGQPASSGNQGTSETTSLHEGGFGYWSKCGGPVNVPGVWTKTATVQGATADATFTVNNCVSRAKPVQAHLEPETFVDPSPNVTIAVSSSYGYGPELLDSWRVTVGGQNVTNYAYNVNTMPKVTAAEGMAGTLFMFTIPSDRLPKSRNDVKVTLKLLDGRAPIVAQRYITMVRPAIVVRGTVTKTVPPTNLACQVVAWGSTYITVTATGGEDGYDYNAPGGMPATGTGSSFTSGYLYPGTYPITVSSGTQTVTCSGYNYSGPAPLPIP
jgi:hypothetical protein